MASAAYNQQRGLLRNIQSVSQQKAKAAKTISSARRMPSVKQVIGGAGKAMGQSMWNVVRGGARAVVRPVKAAARAVPTNQQRVKRLTEWFRAR